MQKNGIGRVLTVFSLVMITVTSVDSVRNLPATAMFGSQLIVFFCLAAVCFLIPTALVAAELATLLPKEGGVYIWVREAFGKRAGLLAIWFQWIENVIWYPAILAFIAGSFAYLVTPELNHSPYYISSIIVITFWALTLLNLFGIQVSSRFAIFCGIVGLFLPMALIITLGSIWVFSGHALQISFSPEALMPSLNNPHMLVALTGIILSFCGMEITTVYAQDVQNPQRDYPKALWISTVILLLTLTFGSLSIAVVIPNNQINLVGGIMQAFSQFFTAYHLTWMTPVMSVMIIIGGLGSLNNWIIAPSKGLLIAAQDGNLPSFFAKENRRGAPTTLLLLQAVIVSIFGSVFVLLPTINSAYWLLTALAAQLYMFMYILMFAAAIYLRYALPKAVRPFKIPGGQLGIWVVAGLGLLCSVFTVGIGMIPPSDITIQSLGRYETLLLGGLILMCIPPLVMRQRRSSL